MNFHIYECDRCHKQQKSADLPVTWSSVKLTKNHACYNEEDREISLCADCTNSIELFISNKNVELINTAYYVAVHNIDLEELKKKASLVDGQPPETEA